MRVLGTILEKLRLKRPQPLLTREQALDAVCVRNPSLQWRETEAGEVVVRLERRADARGRLLRVMFYVPESRDITLDEVGSRVWGLCDGERSVADIVAELVREYKLNKREAEVSVTEYLRMLGQRGMVAFAVPTEAVEAAEQALKQRKRRGKRQRDKKT
jgi:hypothetical protein